jgi:hypothetical protein
MGQPFKNEMEFSVVCSTGYTSSCLRQSHEWSPSKLDAMLGNWIRGDLLQIYFK